MTHLPDVLPWWRRATLAVATVGALAALVGCGSGSASGSSGGSTSVASTAPDSIAVVASTNVWGDVAERIGGDFVTVTAIIDDPAADPHSFEPNAQAQLAVSKAALIIENGGGYDDFMQSMVEASGSTAPVITAVTVAGSGEANEHVWYDFAAVDAVAHELAQRFGELQPSHAATFKANYQAFTGAIAGLTAEADELAATFAGTPIVITEPVPVYLAEAIGLDDRTPEGFAEALEEGTDVPPAVLKDTLALLTGRTVQLLLVNEQTASPETEQLQAAAVEQGIAVVGVRETLPEGQDYESWMGATMAAMRAALGG